MTSQPPRNRRVLISGCGIAGPALAMLLHRGGFVPTVIERSPRLREEGYMIDVWGLGYDLLEKLGLLGAASACAYSMDRIDFVDEQGEIVAGFGGGCFRRVLQGRFFNILRGDLARIVHDAAAGGAEFIFSSSIRTLEERDSGVTVEFVNGSSREFDLVIGADGLHSRVRELTFGPEKQFERYLGYAVASFFVNNYPHRDDGVYLSFARPGRQISRYALRDGRTAFLLLFAEDAGILASRPTLEKQKELIRGKFSGDGWECPQILECLGGAEEVYFDAVSQIRMPAWSRGRIALIGDAAYCPSLMAGSGSAFALLGAYVLAGELANAGGDYRLAFTAYENRIRRFIDKQQRSAARFARSLVPRTALGIALRDFALQLMRVDFLAEWYVRRSFAQPFPLPSYPTNTASAAE